MNLHPNRPASISMDLPQIRLVELGVNPSISMDLPQIRPVELVVNPLRL